jgi:hypothetical protein
MACVYTFMLYIFVYNVFISIVHLRPTKFGSVPGLVEEASVSTL